MSQIQAGRYAATVTACSVGQSKTKGTPGVFCDFTLDDGRTIEGAVWLSENAFERGVQTLRECFNFDDNFDTIEGQLLNKRCSITVEMEAGERDPTKFWPKVKWINPEREPAKPVASDFLKQLSAKAARIAPKAGSASEFPS